MRKAPDMSPEQGVVHTCRQSRFPHAPKLPALLLVQGPSMNGNSSALAASSAASLAPFAQLNLTTFKLDPSYDRHSSADNGLQIELAFTARDPVIFRALLDFAVRNCSCVSDNCLLRARLPALFLESDRAWRC